MLRLEGWRGHERGQCSTCPPEQRNIPTVRCDDCWTDTVLCRACCVSKHAENPLHRVKVCTSCCISVIALTFICRSGTAPTSNGQHSRSLVPSYSWVIRQASAVQILSQLHAASSSSIQTAFILRLFCSVSASKLTVQVVDISNYSEHGSFPLPHMTRPPAAHLR